MVFCQILGSFSRAYPFSSLFAAARKAISHLCAYRASNSSSRRKPPIASASIPPEIHNQTSRFA